MASWYKFLLLWCSLYTRLDLMSYSSMAATVAGVYEAAAERATLLQSKSLQREATGSPLQRDIAGLAVRALREVFVRRLTQETTSQTTSYTCWPLKCFMMSGPG